MKKITPILFLIILAVTVTACIKQNFPDQKPETKSKLEDAKIPDGFNWSTAKTIDVVITGLPTIITIKNTLTISISDGTKLYTALHDMSQSLNLKLSVPSTINEVRFKYGSTDKVLPIVNGKAEHSFIPVLTDEE